MKYENSVYPEMICCPDCNTIQAAIVEIAIPFGSYVHECVNCKYIIMESEWNEVKPFKNETPNLETKSIHPHLQA